MVTFKELQLSTNGEIGKEINSYFFLVNLIHTLKANSSFDYAKRSFYTNKRKFYHIHHRQRMMNKFLILKSVNLGREHEWSYKMQTYGETTAKWHIELWQRKVGLSDLICVCEFILTKGLLWRDVDFIFESFLTRLNCTHYKHHQMEIQTIVPTIGDTFDLVSFLFIIFCLLCTNSCEMFLISKCSTKYINMIH